MKFQDQRIRELEAEIFTLQLCCSELARAMSVRGSLPELRYADVRLVEKGTAAVSEWQRLTDPQAALH